MVRKIDIGQKTALKSRPAKMSVPAQPEQPKEARWEDQYKIYDEEF